jgi:hypothetical protein
MESSSELPVLEEPSTPTLASISSTLRFPAPAADERVSNWVESINATSMSSLSEVASEEGILSESTYEFIDTDGESRDDNATESVASTDFGRPDDVASLADTEHSGEESGDEEEDPNASSVPALPGHDEAVEEAFNTPTIGRSSAILMDDLDKPFAQSIEFEEPFSLGTETISVKHTVAGFDEEKTAETLRGTKWPHQPKRLFVTICQTMTKEGLSTRDPLRILYIGSHSAKQDIIHKIASSVTASVESGKRGQRLRHASSQLYNVVPVSEFGSERTPEIELMHSSGYQIKVEDCTFAQTLKFEDAPERPDVIKLTLDDSFAYHSVPEGDGFTIEPTWELPHVAIFYCSDGDDIEARRTRTVARTFMSRHNIPSIVISHKQLFDRGQCMSLDPHSIHMCLESRDVNGRGNIIHRRFPIDLASFLNIDARQMNRNLAYVTGLHESPKTAADPSITELRKAESVPAKGLARVLPANWFKTARSVCTQRSEQRQRPLWRIGLSIGVLLLSVYVGAFTDIRSYRFARVPSDASISVNSKIMSPVPVLSTISASLSLLAPSITLTSTSVAISTSTRTVTVTQSLSPGPNSLSVVPPMEIGKLTQAAQNLVKSFNKSVICSAEILGDREILIRIPSATKFSWFTKDSMFVNITRENITVDTERLYSSEEGIVLLLPKKEAHGVLNISIITTKKPRVNETFQVDFGTSAFQSWQNMVNKIMMTWMPEDGNIVDPDIFAQMRERAEHMAEEILVQSQSTFAHVDEVRRVAMEQAAAASASLAEIAKSMSLEAAKRSAILSKEVGIQLAEAEKKFSKNLRALHHLREPLDDGILRAQIQSKLLWLKLQGKAEEYQNYEKRAFEAVRRRTAQAKKARKILTDQTKKSERANKKAAKKEARTGRKAKKGGRV